MKERVQRFIYTIDKPCINEYIVKARIDNLIIIFNCSLIYIYIYAKSNERMHSVRRHHHLKKLTRQ